MAGPRGAALAAALALAAGCGVSNSVIGSAATCGDCHGAPPAAPPAGAHPATSSDVRSCALCHPGTVDPRGHLVPGGLHGDGKVEATGGHPAGYAAPGLHGRDFFEVLSGAGGTDCALCHGASYDAPVANGRSCASCHEAAGWVSWRTNCTFCHGARTASYDPASLGSAAPPDAVSERLGGAAAPERTGAHAIHLAGSAIAGPVRCGACHVVPGDLSHVSGRDVRAAVVLTAPGQASLPDPAGYSTVTGTCATACHGRSPTRSPAWASSGLACDGCHGVPPATTVHAGLTGTDLTACAGCHPATITAAGAIDVAGGHHVNGTVDRIGGHAAGYAAPSAHGSQYLDRLAGAAGALDCASCHGASLAFCDACHGQAASGGWVSWRTNCTFCHGARTPSYAAADLTRSSPPDAVSQRLTGVAAPARTGNHLAHLSGRTGFPSLPCATCHVVPATLAHVRLDRRAPVAFDAGVAFTTLGAQELAALPAPLATYSPSTGQCAANYCHGAGLPGGTSTTPAWTSDAPPIADCTTCHGAPAASAATLVGGGDLCATTCNLHVGHANAFGCAVRHAGSAPANAAARHVDGRLDLGWGAGITGTWDPQAKTCGVSCHSDVFPRGWK